MADDIEAQLAAARALQAATSETLRLISTNPGDLTTVLHGILATAAELTGGEAGCILLGVEGQPRVVASHGPPMQRYVGTDLPSDAGDLRGLFEVVGEVARRTDDFAAMTTSLGRYWQEMAEVADVRSYAFTFMRRDDDYVGSLHMFRHEVRPFSDDEVAALVAFGEQASLAIANARLFNDLDQALERQRAMTDVLEAVSTARFDIQPVFDRIVEHAARPVRPHGHPGHDSRSGGAQCRCGRGLGRTRASPTASSTGRRSTPPRRPGRCSPRVSRCTSATGTRSRATCTRTLRRATPAFAPC